MPQWLGTHSDLAENLSLVLSAYIVVGNHPGDALWLLQPLIAHGEKTYLNANSLTHKINILKMRIQNNISYRNRRTMS